MSYDNMGIYNKFVNTSHPGPCIVFISTQKAHDAYSVLRQLYCPLGGITIEQQTELNEKKTTFMAELNDIINVCS